MTWDFNYGKKFTEETEEEILEALKPSYIDGLSLLGGEPFELRTKRMLVKLLKKSERALSGEEHLVLQWLFVR